MKEKLLKKIIKIIPYISHDRLLWHSHSADLLLLILGEMPGASLICPGKLFEYIAINKPILAIIPRNGAASKVIHETNSGFIADHSNTKDIKKMVEFLYQKLR